MRTVVGARADYSAAIVITSYSIHYTKLYDSVAAGAPLLDDMISLARGMPLSNAPDPAPSLVVPYRAMATAQN